MAETPATPAQAQTDRPQDAGSEVPAADPVAAVPTVAVDLPPAATGDGMPSDAVPVATMDDTRLALVTREPEPIPLQPDVAAVRLDIEHLPMSFAGGWRLDLRPDRVDGRETCLLQSPKLPLFDGYDTSAVQLEISSAYVSVHAESNIDPAYPDQGLRVDGGPLVPFEPTLLNERTTYTREPVQIAMAKGGSLEVGLGFWPTWPVTQTHHATFDLDGFDSAYRALLACVEQHKR